MKNLCILLLGSFLFSWGTLFAAPSTPAPECAQGEFRADCLFPTWDSDERLDQAEGAIVQGVMGKNHDNGFLMDYIPRIIDIILKFVAPIVVVTLLWSGILFVTAGSSDDDRNNAKEYFTYAVIGVGFIILSYSILKFVYFIVAR